MKNQLKKVSTKTKQHIAPRSGDPKLTTHQKKVAQQEEAARRHREAVMHQPVNGLDATEHENLK